MSVRAVTVVPGQPETAGVEERPDPPESDGAVLVEGLFMGVCGTDVEITKDGYGQPPPGARTLVLGHESLGRVIEAPDGAPVKAGDLVAGVVRRPDGCAACLDRQWDFCLDGNYVERGIKGRDGYGATRWRTETDFVVGIPAHLGDAGVLMEPTSVVAKAWEQIERIGARAYFAPTTALITGAGPIGLLAALLGVQRGLEVHVLDTVTDGPKPALVADIGAHYHHDGVAGVGLRPDVVVECTGVGSLVLDVVEHAGPNAIVALAGITSGTRAVGTELDVWNKGMVLSNEVVFGSVNAAFRHYEAAADALGRADLSWLTRLISRRVPLATWPTAFDRTPDDVKVVIDLQA
jgi:threonine dehydrogenase-like Zn-dependent dehydrogenase